MHGLINRSIQYFVIDTYGLSSWEAAARLTGMKTLSFEAMLTYDDLLTDQIIEASVKVLGQSREALLEDLGHYLVSNDSVTSVRRLLRFSGVNFVDFVNALEEFPERGHLVLPELDLPELELLDRGGGQFLLRCVAPLKDTGHIMVGMLRAMADDYGALVTLDHLGLEVGPVQEVGLGPEVGSGQETGPGLDSGQGLAGGRTAEAGWAVDASRDARAVAEIISILIADQSLYEARPFHLGMETA